MTLCGGGGGGVQLPVHGAELLVPQARGAQESGETALGVLCPRGQWQFVGLVGPEGWHTWEKEPVSLSPFPCAPTQRLQRRAKVHEDTEGTWGSRVGWQWGPWQGSKEVWDLREVPGGV